jgi:rubrerythrin
VTAPLRIPAQLEAPPLPAGHRLGPIVRTALARDGHTPPPAVLGTPWPARYFGLDRVSAYRGTSASTRRRVLVACATDVLTEAFFVEKLGIGFAAKMVLLAETADERVVYALMGADEARHMAAVAAHLGTRPDSDPAAVNDPFLGLLARAIDGGRRPALAFLVQVVLEGWGLVHYRQLAHHATHAPLRATLADIVKDEALHHGGGLAVLGRHGLSPAHARAVEVTFRELLSLVRAGPQRIMARLGEACGPLDRRERARAFAEMDAEGRVAGQLTLLRRLLEHAPALAARLEHQGLFRPPSPAQCAAIGEGGLREGEDLP